MKHNKLLMIIPILLLGLVSCCTSYPLCPENNDTCPECDDCPTCPSEPDCPVCPEDKPCPDCPVCPEPETPKTIFNVKFVDDSDTVLEEKEVKLGETPYFTGSGLHKAITNTGNIFHLKFFKSWDKEISPATEDVTYKASYNVIDKVDFFTFTSIDDTNVKATMHYMDCPIYKNIIIPNTFNIDGVEKTIKELHIEGGIFVNIKFPDTLVKLHIDHIEFAPINANLILPPHLEEFTFDSATLVPSKNNLIYFPKTIKNLNLDYYNVDFMGVNSIYYGGSKEDFAKYDIDYSNLTNSNIYYDHQIKDIRLLENKYTYYTEVLFENIITSHIHVNSVKPNTAKKLDFPAIFKGSKVKSFYMALDNSPLPCEEFIMGDDVDDMFTFILGNKNNLKYFKVPHNLKCFTFYGQGFYDFETLYIPKALKIIDFSLISSPKFKNIYYEGTKEDLEKIQNYNQLIIPGVTINYNYKY